MIFLDTSVLVAVFYGNHPRHDACMEIFRAAVPATAACGLHSVAELYAVMTRLPVRPAISPEQVLLFIESLRQHVSLIGLDADEYVDVLARAADTGVTGGKIYDALLLACARKIDARTVYTLNARDFRSLAPDFAERVQLPAQP